MFIEYPATPGQLKARKKVYGQGVNDAPYRTTHKGETGKTFKCPYHVVWSAMVVRVYSKGLHKKRPSYSGTTLDPAWHSFMTFRAWMKTQNWEGRSLDKDLIGQTNKHYGPDTCLFIPHSLNNLLTLRNVDRGPYPIGVSKTTIKGYEYFIASCSFYGKQKRLGYFKSADEAHKVYVKHKLQYIKELAQKESCPRIKQALVNIY